MVSLEKKIEELKKEHNLLELESYNLSLKEKYDSLKKLEGTVEVRVMKSSRKSRHVSIVYHASYKMMKDEWNTGKKEENYIGFTCRYITICELPYAPYKKYQIETSEITPNSYNGRIHVKDEAHRYDFNTYKNISVDEFNAIWNLAKVSCHNILDGLLDIKDVKWVMTGTSEDTTFKETDLLTSKNRKIIDIPHIILDNQEAVALNNKFCHLFLNRNIYFVSPNSLEALDLWFKDQREWDSFSKSACASVGERWRGSRIDEYKQLIDKIKNSVQK